MSKIVASIRMEHDKYLKSKVYAHLNNTSISELYEVAIDEYIANHKFPKPNEYTEGFKNYLFKYATESKKRMEEYLGRSTIQHKGKSGECYGDKC